jgi:multicomponent Na+:H+ antiporter subunit D
VIYVAWFRKPAGEWKEKRTKGRFEADWLLLFPTLAVALLVPALGLLAGLDFSPLAWARLIASREWDQGIE